VAIRSLLAAHKANLTTATPGNRDDRFYLDFRQLEYPDLGTGSAQYTIAREDNLIDRGNCEEAIAPMIFDETVPHTTNCTYAKSTDFAHTGDSSYKHTRTAGGVFSTSKFVDGTSTTDMHGVVPGSSYELSAWCYIPTASGIALAEVNLVTAQYYGGGWNYQTDVATSKDAWNELSVVAAINANATGFQTYFQASSTAADTEYFYIDDVKLTTHNVPGSHYLSSGYVENLLTLPDTFTFQIMFKANFAFDVGANEELIGWYVSATINFYVVYWAATDQFWVVWQDGGNARSLRSAAYDNGSAERNINQYITLTGAIDLTTGTTAGSSLWLDKTQDATTWNDATDVKTSVLNKMQVRAYNGAAGSFDIAYVRFWSDRILTDAEVQNDAKDVENEEIYFSLNGYGTGKSRCNISKYVVGGFSTERHRTDPINGAFSANKLALTLNNIGGIFSDDQYAAYVPASNQYNGTVTQKYLRNRCGLIGESWYSGDPDTFFVGRLSQGFPRSSAKVNFSSIGLVAEDGVADLAKSFEQNGRYWEDHKLVNQNLIDRHGCESATAPAMYTETSVTASNALFVRSAAQVYHGRYSYLFTVNGAADTWVDLQDALSSSDMHGLVAGSTYKLSAKVYIPSGAMTGTEMILAIGDYHGSAWSEDTQAAVNLYDAWQHVTVTSTLNASATGIYIRVKAADAAVATETFYIDEITLVCTSDASEHEDVSLFHKVAHRADRKFRQYLANNSFENATIGNSWLVSTGGTLNKDAADGLFGSASGELIPGAAAEQAAQTVTFAGTKKLNVGETYNFSVFVKSTAAAATGNNFVVIFESDSGGSNDNTTVVWSLVGGEGYKRTEVSHTITDPDSDRLVVWVGADAGDTINIDGAMLIQGDRALNYFVVNTNDGAAGIESADDAPEITWPWFGFDVPNIDFLHGWRRLDRGSRIWDEIKSIGLASGARYCGFDEGDTLTLRAYLEDDFSDPVIDSVINDSTVMDLQTAPLGLSANRIIGHGFAVKKSTGLQTLWMATAADSFEEESFVASLSETILNGARWPNTTTFPEYWARIGTVETREKPERLPTPLEIDYRSYPNTSSGRIHARIAADNMMSPRELHAANMGTMTSAAYGQFIENVNWSLDKKGWYEPRGNNKSVIGASEVDLIHLTTASAGAQSTLTEVTEGTVVSGLDATSKADEIRILLQNDTGGTLILSDCGIVGKPVYMFSDSMGYQHDTFVDWEDIAENGEKTFEFGNQDVIDQSQLNALADYYWKVCRGGKHSYAFTLSGMMHWLNPGSRHLLQIGSAGNAESVDSVVEIVSVQCVMQRGSAPITLVQAVEVEENWKHDSNAFARYLASGNDKYLQSVGNVVTIASSLFVGSGHSRVAIGSSSAQDVINATINAVAGRDGGGVVHLTKGTYNIDGPIILKSNVVLSGEGDQTIITTDAVDFIAISSVGSSGSEITGVELRDFRIVQTGVAAGTTRAIVLTYCDNSIIDNVTMDTDTTIAVLVTSCDTLNISNMKIEGDFKIGFSASTSDSVQMANIYIRGQSKSSTTNISGLTVVGDNTTLSNVIVADIINTDAINGGLVNGVILYGANVEMANCTIGNITSARDTYKARGLQLVIGPIHVTNCNVVNVDNTATAAEGIGVDITADNSHISGLNVTGCSGAGIYIGAGADYTQIAASRSTSNGTNFTDAGTNTTASVEDT
jgi:hypothetical protein